MPKKMLCSRQFEPTTGVITRVMVLRGPAFIAAMRYPPNLRNYAYARGLLLPRMEVGALIARKFDHADLNAMGIKQIRVMHTPWVTEFGESTFESTLTVGFHMSGSRGKEWLHGILLQPHMPFMKSETEFCGFAFEIPD